MVKDWKVGVLAAAAGILRRDYPGVSTFEVLRRVYGMANLEPPSVGGLRLLHHARNLIEAKPQGSDRAPRPPPERTRGFNVAVAGDC
jgi:hypothetical protein